MAPTTILMRFALSCHAMKALANEFANALRAMMGFE